MDCTVKVLLDWLAVNSAAIQASSGIVFGIAASVVAWMAYRVSVRANYGWRPFIFLGGYSLGGGNRKTEFNVEFQVWNRRRYPIVIYEMTLSFSLARFKSVEDFEDPTSEDWTVRSERSVGKYCNVVLDPSTSKSFDMNLIVDAEIMMEAPTIEVRYLDTVANKMRKVRMVGVTYSKLRSDYGWWEGLLIYLWPELRLEKRYRGRIGAVPD
jgi:hypothetical protein